jgi:hypothetical protein
MLALLVWSHTGVDAELRNRACNLASYNTTSVQPFNSSRMRTGINAQDNVELLHGAATSGKMNEKNDERGW